MAALKSEELSPNVNGPSNCVDPLDIEQYINPESMSFPSPSLTPNPSTVKPSPAATPPHSAKAFASQPPEQTFSGPSHQYEQFKQQSSLPVGAIANTLALNEIDYHSYGQDSYSVMTPTDGYFGMSTTEDSIDFGTAPRQNEVDMDLGGSSHGMPSLCNIYINPAVVGGQEASTNPHSRPSQQPMRAWPGMHQQAAMQAKAQAEAQVRQQQTREQNFLRSRTTSRSHPEASNAHAEQSISRLLDRMRHSSVSSTRNEEGDDPNDQYANHSRMKKEEEDMDEDERLLASEEGKKLSSKERRQLRNKVSARAFRSRRKEYISQLEGELAAKATEADDLRVRNERLIADNKHLTDFAKMLLSTHHFSSFMQELSSSGGQLPGVSQQEAPEQHQPTQLQAPPQKDVNPTQYQNNMHVGLAMIPEDPYELSAAESTNHNWAIGNVTGFDQQVYAVTSIPDEPIIDTDSLRGKSTIEPLSSFGSTKDEVPEIESIPKLLTENPPTASEPTVAEEDIDFDESDPAFALYSDQPFTMKPTVSVQPEVDPEDRIFGDIVLEKAFGRLELVVFGHGIEDGEQLDAATIEKFDRIRLRMEDLGANIDAVTGRS